MLAIKTALSAGAASQREITDDSAYVVAALIGIVRLAVSGRGRGTLNTLSFVQPLDASPIRGQ